MSNQSAITPDVLSLLREEDHYVKTTQRGERRVKLEKGQTWKIRFIPAQLGPRKTWFARIAKHWVNYKPIVCPVHTHPDFGGDPEAYCAACEMSTVLNDNADETVSKFGFKARANSQWLTYCIVLDMDGNEVDGNELLNPYEFSHYPSTWDELKGFFKGRFTKANPLSVLDYHKGNIFAVTKTAKGTRLDKLDECPIFDDTDPNFDSYIQRLESSIKMPKIVIPTQEQLEAFAAKMEEAAYKSDGGDNRSRRAPAVSDDPLTDNDTDAAPAAPARRTPAPAARPAPAPAAARPTTPAPAARPAAARPAPAPTPAARPAPVQNRPRPLPQEQPPELDGDQPAPPEDDSNPDLNPAAEQEPEQEAPPPPPPRRPAPPVRTTAAAGRKLPPMPAASEPVGTVDEGAEEEQLPEEATDQAPAAAVDEAEGEMAPPPPPPVARRGAAPSALGSAIRDRVSAISGREKK